MVLNTPSKGPVRTIKNPAEAGLVSQYYSNLTTIRAVNYADRLDRQEFYFYAWADECWWLEQKPAGRDITHHGIANRSECGGKGGQRALAEMIGEIGHRSWGLGFSKRWVSTVPIKNPISCCLFPKNA